MFATEAVSKIIKLKPESLLDVGAGTCAQAKVFADNGIRVTAIDLAPVPEKIGNIKYIRALFSNVAIRTQYDCVWAAHVLEHTLNPQLFLEKMISSCKEGGHLAITVPPLKHQIVGGHVNLFNAGILLYRLVLSGVSTKQAMVKQYGYNISVIVKKKSHKKEFWKDLKFDNGDIETISEFLPKDFNYQGFLGDIRYLNWDS